LNCGIGDEPIIQALELVGGNEQIGFRGQPPDNPQALRAEVLGLVNDNRGKTTSNPGSRMSVLHKSTATITRFIELPIARH
jgi:hypothetical protein